MEDKETMNEVVVNKTTKYYFTDYKLNILEDMLEREADAIENIRSKNRMTSDEIVIDVQESVGLNKAMADDYEGHEES